MTEQPDWKAFVSEGFAHLKMGEQLSPPPRHWETDVDRAVLGVISALRSETRLFPETYAWLVGKAVTSVTPRISRCKCPAGDIRVTYPDGRVVDYIKEPEGHKHGATVVDEDPDNRGWSNTVPRELASVLRDREDANSRRAAAWLKRHENDPRVWDLIDSLMDEITRIANE